ncbi:hypothetical protein [Psittacicella hinzii]|uniref:Uncharacterized protein n=1 Tax=Psittacicella hinzii TaxID=2028575 RepID=A0A3A1YT64_9GAMM|nr:hypothetical protein [Psittacicella hinzii]RIY40439.1 hypothetical protein CKF58_00625 [Psittacicella hinzii]
MSLGIGLQLAHAQTSTQIAAAPYYPAPRTAPVNLFELQNRQYPATSVQQGINYPETPAALAVLSLRQYNRAMCSPHGPIYSFKHQLEFLQQAVLDVPLMHQHFPLPGMQLVQSYTHQRNLNPVRFITNLETQAQPDYEMLHYALPQPALQMQQVMLQMEMAATYGYSNVPKEEILTRYGFIPDDTHFSQGEVKSSLASARIPDLTDTPLVASEYTGGRQTSNLGKLLTMPSASQALGNGMSQGVKRILAWGRETVQTQPAPNAKVNLSVNGNVAALNPGYNSQGATTSANSNAASNINHQAHVLLAQSKMPQVEVTKPAPAAPSTTPSNNKDKQGNKAPANTVSNANANANKASSASENKANSDNTANTASNEQVTPTMYLNRLPAPIPIGSLLATKSALEEEIQAVGQEIAAVKVKFASNTPQVQLINQQLVDSHWRLYRVNHYVQNTMAHKPQESVQKVRFAAYAATLPENYEVVNEIYQDPEILPELVKYSFINNYVLILQDFNYFNDLNAAEFFDSLFGLPIAMIYDPETYPNRLLTPAEQEKLKAYIRSRSNADNIHNRIWCECEGYNAYHIETTGLSGRLLTLAQKFNQQGLEFCRKHNIKVGKVSKVKVK